MNCITIKKPYFEDDSYYFIIPGNDKFGIKIMDLDLVYLAAKMKAFGRQDVNKENFMSFKNRPSLRNIDNVPFLMGSIYTSSCESKNGCTYDNMLKAIKKEKDLSRRCVINMANKFVDYMNPNLDTSCLNIIHYTEKKVTLFFRASDVDNELLTDLITIKRFFINPVYKDQVPPEIHVISSTAQNYKHFNKVLGAIQTINKLIINKIGHIKL